MGWEEKKKKLGEEREKVRRECREEVKKRKSKSYIKRVME